MDTQTNEPIDQASKNKVLPIILSMILTAIIVGGGVWYWQKTTFETEINKLQEQFTELSPSVEKIEVFENGEWIVPESLDSNSYTLIINEADVISIEGSIVVCLVKDGYIFEGSYDFLTGRKIRIFFNNLNVDFPSTKMTLMIEQFEGFPYSHYKYALYDADGLIFGYPKSDIFDEITLSSLGVFEQKPTGCLSEFYEPVKVTFKTKNGDNFQMKAGQEKIFKDGNYYYRIILFKACQLKQMMTDVPEEQVYYSLTRINLL